MWNDILRRIAHLRQLDKNFVVFGARHHGYTFNPPASLAELERVEGSLGVALPTELRSVYLEVGNGGVGPDYGLLPLADLEGMRTSVEWPGVEALSAFSFARQSVSGLVAVMDRHYNYRSCVIASGSESGKIVAYEEEVFACIEGATLDEVYRSWLGTEGDVLESCLAAMRREKDMEAIAREQLAVREAHPENTVMVCASLLGLSNFGLREAQASLSWQVSKSDGADFSVNQAVKDLFASSIRKSAGDLGGET